MAKEAFSARYPRELVLNYRPMDTLRALALANEYRLLQVSAVHSYHTMSSHASTMCSIQRSGKPCYIASS